MNLFFILALPGTIYVKSIMKSTINITSSKMKVIFDAGAPFGGG